MALGQMYTIKIHEDSTGTVVFDSVDIVEFNHVGGFVGATSVKREDFTGSVNDAYVVQVTYANGSTPDQSTMTVDALLVLAKDAVNAAYGDGEAGAPTAP